MSTAQEESSSFAATAGTKRKDPTPFKPQDDWQLISQGAEARLWKIPRSSSDDGSDNSNNDVAYTTTIMAKERFSKKYRHPRLDERLTKQRCRMEGRILQKCRARGVAVPAVMRVEPPVLFMEYIHGPTIRNMWQEWMEQCAPVASSDDRDRQGAASILLPLAIQARVNRVGQVMGTVIGKLHSLGIIHGDLTTSNMMIRSNNNNNDDKNNPSPFDSDNPDSNNDQDAASILLIDFGLAKNSQSEEDRAVDLYVLERALASTHPWLPETFVDDEILPCYAKLAPKADKVIQRLNQVRLRGRKRECFG